jgi:hypothetical protein
MENGILSDDGIILFPIYILIPLFAFLDTSPSRPSPTHASLSDF